MARPLRLHLPDGWHHVTARGIERREIFRAAADYEHWRNLLAMLPGRFGLKVMAYVQMPNHYHLIVEARTPILSQAMQWLNVSYGVWFNRKYNRVGPLFQGRFKAIGAEPLEWGLRLSRYVHLNPVRVKGLRLGKVEQQALRRGVAGSADRALIPERLRILRTYPWSSYRSYVGLEKRPEWLTTDDVIGMLGGRKAERKAGYRRYVEEVIREGVQETPWEELRARVILGTKEFVDRAARSRELKGSLREQTALRHLMRRADFEDVVRAVEKVKGEAWSAFVNRYGDWGRDMVLYLSRKHTEMTLRALGDEVGGLDYVAVAAAVRRMGERLDRDRVIRKNAADIEAKLYNV